MSDLPTDQINYGQFGQNFIELVVTADRINQALGPAMKIPSMSLQEAPGNIATAKVAGTTSVTDVTTLKDKLPDVWFSATARLGFDLALDIGPTEQPFKGTIELTMRMHVQTYKPLTIFLEVQPVTNSDVKIALEAENPGAELWKGVVEDKMPAAVVDAVNQQMSSPDVIKSRTIDVLKLVEATGGQPGPSGPGGGGDGKQMALGVNVPGTLGGGADQSWTGTLDSNVLTTTVWVKLQSGSEDSDVTADLLDANGGRIGTLTVQTDGSKDYMRGSGDVLVPEKGMYTLRLDRK